MCDGTSFAWLDNCRQPWQVYLSIHTHCSSNSGWGPIYHFLCILGIYAYKVLNGSSHKYINQNQGHHEYFMLWEGKWFEQQLIQLDIVATTFSFWWSGQYQEVPGGCWCPKVSVEPQLFQTGVFSFLLGSLPDERPTGLLQKNEGYKNVGPLTQRSSIIPLHLRRCDANKAFSTILVRW